MLEFGCGSVDKGELGLNFLEALSAFFVLEFVSSTATFNFVESIFLHFSKISE